MTLKRFIQLLLFASTVCWTSLGVLIVRFDPTTLPMWAFVFFYIVLFLGCTSLVGSLGLAVRLLVVRRFVPHYHIAMAMRQSLWCAIALCVSLILLRAQLFTWWIISLLLVALISVEVLFLARRIQTSYPTSQSHNL